MKPQNTKFVTNWKITKYDIIVRVWNKCYKCTKCCLMKSEWKAQKFMRLPFADWRYQLPDKKENGKHIYLTLKPKSIAETSHKPNSDQCKYNRSCIFSHLFTLIFCRYVFLRNNNRKYNYFYPSDVLPVIHAYIIH